MAPERFELRRCWIGWPRDWDGAQRCHRIEHCPLLECFQLRACLRTSCSTISRKDSSTRRHLRRRRQPRQFVECSSAVRRWASPTLVRTDCARRTENRRCCCCCQWVIVGILPPPGNVKQQTGGHFEGVRRCHCRFQTYYILVLTF